MLSSPWYKRLLFLLPIAAIGLAGGSVMAQDADLEESLYGRTMLSQQERDQWRQRLHNTRSVEERQQIHNEYRNLMRQRAQEQGYDPDGIYGRTLMNQQERRALAERMQSAQSVQERQRIQAEHREQMRQRILEQRQQQPRQQQQQPRQQQQQPRQQQQQQQQQMQDGGGRGRGGSGRY